MIEDIVPTCYDKNEILTGDIYGILLNQGGIDSYFGEGLIGEQKKWIGKEEYEKLLMILFPEWNL